MGAAYPSSVLSWAQRVNAETVWAADPNQLAAEVDAIEQFVGTNPQIESSAVNGATKTFSSMSARLSDAMLQRGHPFIEISRSTNWNVSHNSSSTHTTQNPFGTATSNWGNYLNGSGTINIQDTGLWLINAFQRWEYASSGWVMQQLLSNGSVLRRDIFSYDQFPSSGTNTYGERFLGLDGQNEVVFLGRLNKGTVVSVSSGNFTNVNPLAVQSMNLSAYYIRP